MTDVYAALVSYLGGHGYKASAFMPMADPLPSLPWVDLQSAGPGITHPGINTLGADTVDVDVGYYVSATDWLRGGVPDQARALRHLLAKFQQGHMRVVAVTRPHRMPDRNPNIRRMEMTVSVRLPA